MKQIKKDLDTVLKELKTLTRKTEGMVKKIDRLGKAKAVKKPRAKAKVKKRAVPKKIKTTAKSKVTIGRITSRPLLSQSFLKISVSEISSFG